MTTVTSGVFTSTRTWSGWASAGRIFCRIAGFSVLIDLDGEWSHCGVDAFTLVRIEGDWKISSLAWSIEQPPACRQHPDGPPLQ